MILDNIKAILKKNNFILKNYKKYQIKKNFSSKFFLEKRLETENLIKSILEEDYIIFKKRKYFKNFKNKLSNTAFVEINNSCNINCVMCDTKSSSRKKSLMKLDMFEKSIKILSSKAIKYIGLHTIGDPLANNRLDKYFEILKKNSIKTSISSNCLMLEKHLHTLLNNIDVCNFLRISVDGATKNTYEKIRFGGKWEVFLRNYDLACKKLLPIGYSINLDYTLTKENFNEIGLFLSSLGKKIGNTYANVHFNFMNSLAPDNSYFEKNNVIPEHTHTNSYCDYINKFHPYILVDGRISVCCRDYDGSLVIGSINSNESIENAFSGEKMNDLKNAHENANSNSIKNYSLCSKCYIVDERVATIWRNLSREILYKYPNECAFSYQDKFDELLFFLRSINKYSFLNFKKKIKI